jgi:hypothetical protein
MEVVEDNLDITSAIKEIKEQKVALTLDKTFTVPFEMTSLEAAYDKPIKYWNDEFVECCKIYLGKQLRKKTFLSCFH